MPLSLGWRPAAAVSGAARLSFNFGARRLLPTTSTAVVWGLGVTVQPAANGVEKESSSSCSPQRRAMLASLRAARLPIRRCGLRDGSVARAVLGVLAEALFLEQQLQQLRGAAAAAATCRATAAGRGMAMAHGSASWKSIWSRGCGCSGRWQVAGKHRLRRKRRRPACLVFGRTWPRRPAPSAEDGRLSRACPVLEPRCSLPTPPPACDAFRRSIP